MGTHINSDGKFQSDKYPTCPAGKVPLSVEDPTARDLLWQYAQRRRSTDAEFSDDLESALRAQGYNGWSAGTEEICKRIRDLAFNPTPLELVAVVEETRLALEGREGALAAANTIIAEAADEAKRLQERIDFLESTWRNHTGEEAP